MVCLAGSAGQVVVAEVVDVARRRSRSAICSSIGDGKTSEPKIGCDVLGLDLLDQIDDLGRRWLAEVGRLDRPDHVPAVGVGEVGVGVVVGDQLALFFGDRVEGLTDRGVEVVDECLELVEVGVELLGALRGDRRSSSSRMMSAYTFTSVGSVHRCGFGLPPSSGNEKSYLY